MKRLAWYLVISIGLSASLFIITNAIAVGLVTGVLATLLLAIFDQLLTIPYGWRLLFQSLKYRNTEVRVSISYLIRIEYRHELLLVRGRRYTDQFQPVGGVYKTNPSSVQHLQEMRVRPDNLVPADATSVDDLRIRVKGNRLLSLLQWFDTGKNREVGATREFYEEVVAATGIRPGIVGEIRFDFRHRHVEPLRFSDFANSQELLVADIFDIVCADGIKQELHDATVVDQTNFAWVDRDRIDRLGAIPGQPQTMKIAPTAKWLD